MRPEESTSNCSSITDGQLIVDSSGRLPWLRRAPTPLGMTKLFLPLKIFFNAFALGEGECSIFTVSPSPSPALEVLIRPIVARSRFRRFRSNHRAPQLFRRRK